MNWTYVLYVSKPLSLDNLRDRALQTGYKFFLHNKDVYFVTKTSYEKTGITINDLY